MTTIGAATPTEMPDTRWRTRDIVVAAVIGVAFGVVFWIWTLIWFGPLGALSAVALPVRDLFYAVWLVPAVLAPLVIRKPGAALFAEMVAAGVAAFLGGPWGVDTLLSGFVQGAAAELVFAFTLYRSWTYPVIAAAAVASAAAAWIHDWALYYADVDVVVQLVRGIFMAISAVVIVAGGSIALHRALKQAGVLEGFPRLTATALRTRDLTVTYPGADGPAFAGVDLDLEPGSVLLIVGPSGSGKSTLALAIAGLIPGQIPAIVGGTLQLDEEDAFVLGPVGVAAKVGLVLQDPSTQLVMDRVEDDVAFGLENRGWPREAMHARVPQALAEVGLGGTDRLRTRQLSGGQQQRLALAGALAPRPGLLVLDEPTASLDTEGASALLVTLATIRAARTATLVLIEHQVDAVWPLADVVLAFGPDGRPIDVGSPAKVLARSADAMRAAGIWLPGEDAERPTRSPAPAGDVLVRTRGLRFGYDRGDPAVRDVTFDASAGERIAVVGPNGAGKSTFGRLLVGLLRPDHGTVDLHGEDPAEMPATTLARHAGYVFQEPERQFLAQTVGDEVRLGLDDEERGRVDHLMTRLGLPLDRFEGRSPYRLSGGEQRRLSLACILIRRPDVLVLDEPTFGQDRLGYEGLLGILDEHLDAGASLIAATHDQRFVRDVATRIVEMDTGWIIRDEPGAGEDVA